MARSLVFLAFFIAVLTVCIRGDATSTSATTTSTDNDITTSTDNDITTSTDNDITTSTDNDITTSTDNDITTSTDNDITTSTDNDITTSIDNDTTPTTSLVITNKQTSNSVSSTLTFSTSISEYNTTTNDGSVTASTSVATTSIDSDTTIVTNSTAGVSSSGTSTTFIVTTENSTDNESSTITSTPTLPPTTTLDQADFCAKNCPGGSYSCDVTAQSCGCSEGFYNYSNVCTVVSAQIVSILFNELNYSTAYSNTSSDPYQTLSDGITKELKSLFSDVAGYISSEVISINPNINTLQSSEAKSTRTKREVPSDGVVVITQNTVISSAAAQIVVQNITSYTNTCIDTCFGQNSSANVASYDYKPPCNMYSDLCAASAHTKCQNVSVQPYQYACVCEDPSMSLKISNPNGGGGEIFACSICAKEDVCQNGGTCSNDQCQCTWSYMGQLCDNPLPLAMVIVACILGALTLIFLGGLIYTSCFRSAKKTVLPQSYEHLWEAPKPKMVKSTGVNIELPAAPSAPRNEDDRFETPRDDKHPKGLPRSNYRSIYEENL